MVIPLLKLRVVTLASLLVVSAFSKTCLDSEDASLLKLLLQDNLDDALSSLGQSDCIPVPAPLPVPKSGQSQSLLPVYPNCGKSSPSTSTQIFKVRIAGGSDAGLGTYPWMALIGYSYKNSGDVQFGCGGTLINENYILTAAHCVVELPQGYAPTTVRLGEYNTSSPTDCVGLRGRQKICSPPPQDIPVFETIPHENYSRTGRKENDIALIRLKGSAALGEFVSPVCLPTGNNVKNLEGASLTVAGWGRTTESNPDNYPVLQMVQIPFQQRDKCHTIYGPLMDNGPGDGRFCAGGEVGKDSCKGDSGGPLMIDAQPTRSSKSPFGVIQVGVVSLGPQVCDESKAPGLYTNVSHYLDWILSNLSK